MRNFLYATTALTAAALIAGAAGEAAAQTTTLPQTGASPSPYKEQLPAPPPTTVPPPSTAYKSASAERIKLGLSGYFQQWGVATDQKFKTRPNSNADFKTQKTNDVTQKHNSEVCVIGQTTLDSGLTIGINVQIEANTESDQIDESYLFVESPTMGQMILGDENNAAYLLHVTAPDGGISLDSGDLLNLNAFETNGAPVFDTPLGTTNMRLLDNDSGKFTYITPRFAGFQAGISYIPELQSGGDSNSSLRNSGGRNNGMYNGIAPGLNYKNVFGDFGVQASGGYMWAETGAGYGGAQRNLIAYNAGLQLSYAGFSAGGAWIYVPQGTGPNYKLNGTSWTAGAAYEFGPYKIGLDYMTGTNNPTSSGGQSRLDQGIVSGTYTLGPGIRLVGGVMYYNWEEENDLSKNKDGIGGLTGLKLSF